MQIKKRAGYLVNVDFNKIQERIKKQSKGLKVDYDKVSKKVIQGLYDGVTTEELDQLAAQTAAMMTVNHPDYGFLAGRLSLTSLYKKTPKAFSDAINILKKTTSLLSEELVKLVENNADKINSKIVSDRDFSFDYFGLKTLEKSYLLKNKKGIVETPQYMYMRVALGICKGDLELAFEIYNYLSLGDYTHATPTLFNSGTHKPQLSSCFLLGMKEDSIVGIYDTLKDCAVISQWAGGIGLHIHNVRANGSKISGTGGVSNGIIPMLKNYNETARYVDQGGGKRKGSFAIYLEPWHSDIEDFLELKKNHGKEEMRARDLFLAIWMNDLFMERLVDNGQWTLFSPDEAPGLSDVYGKEFKTLYEKYELGGKGRKTIKAQELWERICIAQIETGVPYIGYKDHVNEKSNQKNLGTIKSSNLCVAPETNILTDKGYVPISNLEDKKVSVWNGKRFSETTVRKTGQGEKILSVLLSNGQNIECTEYHKFYIQEGYDRGTGKNKLQIIEKRTNDLQVGDKIIKPSSLPIIEIEGELKDAYTQGFFTGDGCRFKGKNHIDLYGEKMRLKEFLIYSNEYYSNNTQERIRISVDDSYEKYQVPLDYSISSRLNWFAGLCDSDGCLLNNNDTNSIQIASIHKEFLLDIQLMLQTLGVNSKVVFAAEAAMRMLPDSNRNLQLYNCKELWRIIIGADAIYNLTKLGFSCNRLPVTNRKPDRNAEQFVKVVSVEDNGRIDDTFCVNEPLENKVMFNGILTGNCIEINEFSSKEEQAVCNLASIALPKFISNGEFDHNRLLEVIPTIIKGLNNVIDVNFYPTKETKVSNLKHRPIGVGVQGLADVFAILKMDFDSPEAAQLNKDIFETIYYGSLKASCELAKEKVRVCCGRCDGVHDECAPYEKVRGAYESFKDSPLSKGIFQFDMWGVIPDSGRWDWEKLRADIIKHGVVNSLLVALMPTASTSQILGNNECFEPFTSNIYLRRTLAGEFPVINKHLVRDLEELNLWDESMKNKLMRENGSIQSISSIPNNIKSRYKTAYEIKQKVIIDMAADRSPYICQAQSMNLFMSNPTIAKLSSMQVFAWQKGLKTGQYYLRSKSAVDAIKFTVTKEEENMIPPPNDKEGESNSQFDCVGCGS